MTSWILSLFEPAVILSVDKFTIYVRIIGEVLKCENSKVEEF